MPWLKGGLFFRRGRYTTGGMITFATIEEAWGPSAKETFGANKTSLDTLKRFTHPSAMPRSCLQGAEQEASALAKAVAAVFEEHGLQGILRLLPRPCLGQLLQSARCQVMGRLAEDCVGYVLLAVVGFVVIDALARMLLRRGT